MATTAVPLGGLGNLIFISYRRADSAAQTLALQLELRTRLKTAQVFLDTRTIQGGDLWARRIQDTLRLAAVVIAVIGPAWAGGRGRKRRIDDPEDWVFKEISAALKKRPRAIIPLLVNGANPLRQADLPPSMKGLAAIQPLRLDIDRWDSDIDAIIALLQNEFAFQRKSKRITFPKPDPKIARTIPVSRHALEKEIASRLPDWRVEFSDDPDRRNYSRVEFTRDFEFKSFKEAAAFIDIVTTHAKTEDHHPTLMNLWRTVSVALSTWDAGYRITALDLKFARYLEQVYRGK